MNGCDIIIHKFMKHFVPSDINTTMVTLRDLRSFERRKEESLEEAFSRWDIISERARRNDISPGDPKSITYNWFAQLHIPDTYIPQLIADFKNNLPSTEIETEHFRTKIINLARMVDKRSPYTIWAEHG